MLNNYWKEKWPLPSPLSIYILKYDIINTWTNDNLQTSKVITYFHEGERESKNY